MKEPYDPTGMHNAEPQGSLAALNKANWAHTVQDPEGDFTEHLNDLDCLIIWMAQRDLKEKKPGASPHVYLFDLEVDLGTMTAKYYKEHHGIKQGTPLKLVRDPNNDRRRCQETTKGYRDQFNIKQAIADGFPRHKGEFGFRWKTLQNNRCQPSTRQVIAGLQKYLVNKITEEQELPQEISVDKYGNS